MTRRRKFLKYLAVMAAMPVSAGSEAGGGMYGLITRITAVPGRRDEMIAILKESASGMPGCLSSVVAEDSSDENVIWVTEVWESLAIHDASLSLPSVRFGGPGCLRSAPTDRGRGTQIHAESLNRVDHELRRANRKP